MATKVVLDEVFAAEFAALDTNVQDELLARLSLLAKHGTQLGRPHVAALAGAVSKAARSLHFTAGIGTWHFAFAVDGTGRTATLVAGERASGTQPSKRLATLADRRLGVRGKPGATLKAVVGELSPARQSKIATRANELAGELNALTALHRIAAKLPTAKAATQTSAYLSALTAAVSAHGGELELIVRLPKHRTVRLRDVGVAVPTAKR